MKQKLKVFCSTFIIFFTTSFGRDSEHYRYLQEWRGRLEHEKEEEKKEETWNNTFCIGGKQVLDQAIKVVIATIIGGLVAYPLGSTPKEKNVIAATTFFLTVVTLNWNFHSPIQKRIIHKKAREIMIKEISSQIEKAK